MRKGTSQIKAFGVGFLLGVVLTWFLTLKGFAREYVAARVGELLDTDFLYLKNGDMMRGRIISEEGGNFVFQSTKGLIIFGPNEVEKAERNYYTRYIRAIW